MFKKRMAGLAEPQPPLRVDIGSGHTEIAAITRLCRNQIELCHHVKGHAEGPCNSADFRSKPPENALNLALLIGLQECTLGAEAGHAGRLNIHGFARAAGPMDDPLKLVPVIDRHRKHIMIAAYRSVGIAEDFPQLRISKQTLDLILD